jgi:putative ABC transport system permease protein
LLTAANLRFEARTALREGRGSWARLLLVVLCLAAGFAAFFATALFSARVLAGVRAESRAILGGDAAMIATGRFPEDIRARALRLPGVEAAVLVQDFATVTEFRGQTRLVEVRAADEGYPLAGRLTLEPPGRPRPGAVFVERSLAEAWELGADATLRLGTATLPVGGVLALDESRQAGAFALGPRVLMTLGDAEAAGLLSARSRLTGRLILRFAPGAQPRVIESQLRALAREATPRLRVQNHEDAAAALARPLRNLNRFVQQLGVMTLLLSTLGAWAILSAFVGARARDAAILRCLGASPGAPFRIYGLLVLLLLGLALLLGFAAGLAAAAWAPRLLGDLVPTALRGSALAAPPVLETLLAVLLVLLLCLPSLLALRGATPLGLLREGMEARAPVLPAALCLGAATLAAAALLVRSAPTFRAGLGMVAGLAALFLVLYGTARALLWGFRRLSPRTPLALRLGLGQLGARPSLTGLLMAVLGLAVFLTLSAQLVKDDVIGPIAAQAAAAEKPNLFLLDVQPGQRAAVVGMLARETGRAVLEAPIVRARLVSVAGRPVADRRGAERNRDRDRANPGEDRGEAFRTREQNLTYRERLGASEALVAGRFWEPGLAADDGISVEEGFAESIGAKLGDALVFQIQGQERQGRITSLRKVRWQSFQPNFFLVLHPSLLQDAPALHLLAVEADDGARARIRSALAKGFPNVTPLDVSEILGKVTRILDTVAAVTRVLAGLMILSALLVLAASLLAGRLGRARDLALLRTLGAPDALLLRSLAWEFTLLGGTAALASAVLAWNLAKLYVVRVLELDSSPSPLAALLLLALAAALTAAVGLAGSVKALRQKPLEVLRGE